MLTLIIISISISHLNEKYIAIYSEQKLYYMSELELQQWLCGFLNVRREAWSNLFPSLNLIPLNTMFLDLQK